MATTMLPNPRGPLTDHLFTSLRRPTHRVSVPPVLCGDALADDDFQLALYCCYELHYQGFTGVSDLISLFGLHRRMRGSLVGHLASFEMNSVGPMGRYSSWLERLGVPAEGRHFYDVHVEADEAHQHVAVNDLVGGLLEVEPEQAQAVMFGARAIGLVESAFAGHLVSAWKGDRISLWTS
jgi:hypothetical protein